MYFIYLGHYLDAGEVDGWIVVTLDRQKYSQIQIESLPSERRIQYDIIIPITIFILFSGKTFPECL